MFTSCVLHFFFLFGNFIGTSAYVIFVKGTLKILLRLRTMRWREYSWLSWWTRFNQMSHLKWRNFSGCGQRIWWQERSEGNVIWEELDTLLLTLKVEERRYESMDVMKLRTVLSWQPGIIHGSWSQNCKKLKSAYSLDE